MVWLEYCNQRMTAAFARLKAVEWSVVNLPTMVRLPESGNRATPESSMGVGASLGTAVSYQRPAFQPPLLTGCP